MQAATERMTAPCAAEDEPSIGQEDEALHWGDLLDALKDHLAHTRPREPRRNNVIVVDALMLLNRGDIPMDSATMPTPAELIECVELWRQDLGVHLRPKR